MSLSEIDKLTEIVSNQITFIDACGQLCIDTDSVRRGVRKAFDTQAAEIERLRASLDEAVGVLRQIADRAGDGRRTASLPVIAREARDFITKHGGGRPAEQGVVMDFREEVQELTAIIRRQALNPNHGGERE